MSSLKLKLIAALLMGHLVPCALATNEVCWVGKVGDDCRGQPDGCTHHGVLVSTVPSLVFYVGEPGILCSQQKSDKTHRSSASTP